MQRFLYESKRKHGIWLSSTLLVSLCILREMKPIVHQNVLKRLMDQREQSLSSRIPVNGKLFLEDNNIVLNLRTIIWTFASWCVKLNSYVEIAYVYEHRTRPWMLVLVVVMLHYIRFLCSITFQNSDNNHILICTN